MLNRTEQPAFKQIDHIHFIKAEKQELVNKIPVFVINAGEQDLLRIEFLFKNSGWSAENPLLPNITNSMLTEGTHSLSSAEIAGKIDYYGAFFQPEYGYDQSSLTLYTLSKYLGDTLPVIKEMLTGSVFPDRELQTLIRNQKQAFKVSLEKNSTLARREFAQAIFGDSIYGYQLQIEDFDKVTSEDLSAYYKTVYHPHNCTIVISGKVDAEAIDLVNNLFGSWTGDGKAESFEVHFTSATEKEHYIEKQDALQSAIRIGVPMINRKHPDFIGLQVLNTVLGGYFGSRLMNNIREDKGYTYGIGSGIASLQHAGYFFIATEVGVDVTSATLVEIEKEVNLLKTELVEEDELELVKNYLMGSLLGDLENAFSHADKFKNLHFFGLGYEYYERYIQTVKNITSKELLDLANKYFKYEDFYKIVVGKK